MGPDRRPLTTPAPRPHQIVFSARPEGPDHPPRHIGPRQQKCQAPLRTQNYPKLCLLCRKILTVKQIYRPLRKVEAKCRPGLQGQTRAARIKLDSSRLELLGALRISPIVWVHLVFRFPSRLSPKCCPRPAGRAKLARISARRRPAEMPGSATHAHLLVLARRCRYGAGTLSQAYTRLLLGD